MFSVIQETESGQKIWPDITHVFTTCGGPAEGGQTKTVNALGGPCGHMTFYRSRQHHVIYVMNEAGSTCAHYDIGRDPNAEVPKELVDSQLPEAA